jgi:CRP-like cAMP-binding protein
VVDRDLNDALARSFLAELADRLRAEGERADYPAGTTVHQAGSDPAAALVVRGLIRVYLNSPGGRQVTVRYARPGDAADAVAAIRGITATQAALLPELETLDLADALPALDCPVVMVHSAHLPHREEPERFRELLTQVRQAGPARR